MKAQFNLTNLLITIVIGFLSGMGGYMVSKAYGSNLSSFLDLYVPSTNQVGNREIIIQEAKKVIVEQETRISQVLEKADKAQYGVFRKKNLVAGQLNIFYSSADRISQSVAVTSDGWMITALDIVYQPTALVVAKGDKVYNVQEVIRDPKTGLVFLKVEANGLPVVEFAALESITLGQSVVAYDVTERTNKIVSLSDLSVRDAVTNSYGIHSVEEYSHKLKVSETLNQQFNGSPLLNLNGQIVAYFYKGDQAVRASYINFLLKSLLKDQKLIHPYLGISYAMSDDLVGVDLNGQGGAVIVKNSRGIVINKNSPLIDKLQEGDVVTGVENIQLSKSVDLASAIYDFRMGNTIKLKVVRNGERLEIDYTLAEIK